MSSTAKSELESWEAVIGLEVHAQLETRTKLFCGCATSFGAEPNTQICPVCLGLPGSLPVMNRVAFRHALKAGLALNCMLNPYTKWDRKNYYYPDLPKNYQISQYDLPFAVNGWLDIVLHDGTSKRIGITRVHLEEDAGKLVHDESGTGGESGVDLNRTGTPLIEIVSEPDLRSAAEARAYMESLAQTLYYLGVCDCNMQEGSLRCDANVSIRPRAQTTYNTRREIKNMNSFRFVEQAILTEIEEQKALYRRGEKIVQSTRLFNGQTGEIRTMRAKEDSNDYRYFPEPDLPPVTLETHELEAVRATIGELPQARLKRYREELQLNEKDATVLVERKAMGDYFEALLACGIEQKFAAVWVLNESQVALRELNLKLETCGVPGEATAALLKLVAAGTINRTTAKETVWPALLKNPALTPQQIVAEQGLAQVSDSGEIEATVEEILNSEPKLVADFVAGKDAVVNAIFGRCMKALKGKANPGILRPLLEQKLLAKRKG